MKVGLLVNPWAGIGGPVALKGSDGDAIRAQALALGSLPRAGERTRRALVCLQGLPIDWHAAAGDMGERWLREAGLPATVVYVPATEPTAAADTRAAAQALLAAGVDVLLLAGGDGTLRDVFDAVGSRMVVLGIPAGVKMHSGVFAVSPEATGEMLRQLAGGGLLGVRMAEVRDIDEAALRAGRVGSRFYGELPVPAETRYLQQVKEGGRESEALVQRDIADYLIREFTLDTLWLAGPGTTACAVPEALGLPYTLMGVDAYRDGRVLLTDASEQQLLALLQAHHGPLRLVLGITGGQGFVLGRGNQMLSPAVIRAIGRDNTVLVAAKSKLAALQGRPLRVDTGDVLLDQALAGFWPVLAGFDDRVLYRVG